MNWDLGKFTQTRCKKKERKKQSKKRKKGKNGRRRNLHAIDSNSQQHNRTSMTQGHRTADLSFWRWGFSLGVRMPGYVTRNVPIHLYPENTSVVLGYRCEFGENNPPHTGMRRSILKPFRAFFYPMHLREFKSRRESSSLFSEIQRDADHNAPHYFLSKSTAEKKCCVYTG